MGIERLVVEDVEGALTETQRWTFIKAEASANPELVDLAPLLDEAVLQLRKEVPLQLVVNMFQKMASRSDEVLRRYELTDTCLEPSPCALFAGRKVYRIGHEDGHRVVADIALAAHRSISSRSCKSLATDVGTQPSTYVWLQVHRSTLQSWYHTTAS